MQVKVVKSDGSLEQYLHTKVLGTLGNALAMIDQPNIYAAEQFADAITFHLYHTKKTSTITSEEIYLLVQAVLTATGYANAAAALNDFHLHRKIKRKRIEVVDEHADHFDPDQRTLWNKSTIVHWLMENKKMDFHVARVVASSVEEKILNIGILRIRKSLIKHLVLSDIDVMLEAQEQLCRS
jgi:hypothetical protein